MDEMMNGHYSSKKRRFSEKREKERKEKMLNLWNDDFFGGRRYRRRRDPFGLDLFSLIPVRSFGIPERYWEGEKLGFPESSFKVEEEEEKLVIRGKPSGVPMENVKISINEKEKTMTIKGELEEKEEKKDEEGNVMSSHKRFSSFEQTFPLPENMKKEEIKADVEKGELIVTIPKQLKEEKKEEIKQIKISFSED